MLSLKTGQLLQLRKGNICVTGTLMEIGGGELTLSLEGYMALMPGDEIELEVPQDKEAPYLLRGRLEEVGPGGACTLEVIGEAFLSERRQFYRIPTNFQVEYFLLTEEPGEPEHLQGKILDISSGGAFLSTGEPLELDCQLMLLLEISPGWKEEFTTGIGGKVVREHKGQPPFAYGYGVEFNRRLALSG